MFNFELKIREAEGKWINPSNIIIIEGHLIFNNEDLIKLMDLKVFIDTDDDVRLSRRIMKFYKQRKDAD